MDFIDVPLRASRKLALLLAAAHAAAIVAVIALPAPWWLRLPGVLLLLASGTIMIRHRALLQHTNSVVRLRLMRDGSCQLETRDQRQISGQLRPGWFVSPPMVVVRIACSGERSPRSIALLPDAADADTLRRLRIFLRFAIKPSIGDQ